MNKKLKTIRQRHVSRRSVERYDVYLSKKDQESLIGKIQKSICLKYYSLILSGAVFFGKFVVRLLYEKNNKQR